MASYPMDRNIRRITLCSSIQDRTAQHSRLDKLSWPLVNNRRTPFIHWLLIFMTILSWRRKINNLCWDKLTRRTQVADFLPFHLVKFRSATYLCSQMFWQGRLRSQIDGNERMKAVPTVKIDCSLRDVPRAQWNGNVFLCRSNLNVAKDSTCLVMFVYLKNTDKHVRLLYRWRDH